MDELLSLINKYDLNKNEILEIIDNSNDENILEIIVNELENIYG